MSDRDTAPDAPGTDPLDRAYAEAEAMLADEPARDARRAQVLGAVAQAAAPAPRAAGWTALARGAWLAAAGVAGLGLFVAYRILPSPVSQLQPQSPPRAVVRPAPAPAGPAEGLTPPPAAASAPRTGPARAAPPERSSAAPQTAAPPMAPLPAPPAARAQAEADSARAGDETSGVVVTGQRREAKLSADTAPRTIPDRPVAGEADASARLRAAAASGRTDQVGALLAGGLAVDAPDANGDTALMLSVRGGHPATAALLRRHGAGLDVRNHAGESARDMAAELDDPRMDRALGLRR